MFGVTHSNTQRIKYFHMDSHPCRDALDKSPSAAMQDAVFLPTLLYLNNRLLRFSSSLQKGSQYHPVLTRSIMGRGKAIFSVPRSKATITLILCHLQKLLLSISITVQRRPSITPPAPPNCYLITFSHCRSVLPIWFQPCTRNLSSCSLFKPWAEVFSSSFSLRWTASEKIPLIFCEGHNIKINCVVLNKS